MRPSIILKAIILFAVLFMFVSAGHMRQEAIDYDKMDKDLRIMENVLSAFLTEDASTLTAPAVKPRGAYIDGFGVVFIIPSIPQFVEVRSREGRVVIRNYIEADRRSIIQVEPRGVITEEADTAKVRELVMEFLGSYAGLIKQIKPDDWVTVIVNPSSSAYSLNIIRNNETQRVGGLHYTDLTDFPGSVIMSVKKADITRYRTEEIDYETFKNAVVISEIDDEQSGVDPAMQDDIKIVKGILESVVEDFFNTSLNSEAIHGISLEDFGVLFTINVDNYFTTSRSIVIREKEDEDILKDVKIEIDLDRLKDEINRVVEQIEPERYVIEAEKLKEELNKIRQYQQEVIQEKIEEHAEEIEKLKAEMEQERKKLQEELNKMVSQIKKEEIEKEIKQVKEQIEAEVKQLKEQIEVEIEQQLVEKVDSEDIEKLKDVLIETLGDYGNSIRSLQPGNRIAVYLFTRSTRSKTLDDKTNLTIVAEFKDILDYNGGVISPDEFKEKIKSRIF
ncbi:hypothetical protein AMJ80_05280 [bacterium SM23_31]|nr:MAG: hypothetical protein AMJ80_05280 [bacterium SM23_31]